MDIQIPCRIQNRFHETLKEIIGGRQSLAGALRLPRMNIISASNVQPAEGSVGFTERAGKRVIGYDGRALPGENEVLAAFDIAA